jgi:hypothetical protein
MKGLAAPFPLEFHKGFVTTKLPISFPCGPGVVKPTRQIHRVLLAALYGRWAGIRSQPSNRPNPWGSSPGDSTAARYSRRAPTPARVGASRRWTGILPQRSIIQRRSFSLVRKLQAIWQARPTRPQLPVSDPYPRGSHFSPVMAYPFPVQPNEFPFRPGTGIGSQSVASTSRLRGRSA